MKWIGLTGGIASGKTTVARMLREKGFPVVEADRLAHEVLAPNSSAWGRIVQVFGSDVLKEGTKEIDRKKLGEIVFKSPEKRKQLEEIVHPLVRALARAERDQLFKEGHKFVFYEVPLLFEKGLKSEFDAVVVVSASKRDQIERLQARNSLSEEASIERIQAQIPNDKKVSQADFVIENNADLEQLARATDLFLQRLGADGRR